MTVRFTTRIYNHIDQKTNTNTNTNTKSNFARGYSSAQYCTWIATVRKRESACKKERAFETL